MQKRQPHNSESEEMPSSLIARLKRNKILEQPLDSTDAFKYIKYFWNVIGTNPPGASARFYWRLLYFVYSAFMNLLGSIWFPLSMLVNLYINNSFENFVLNLSLSGPVSLAVVKQFEVLRQRKRIRRSYEFLRLLDERSAQHWDDRQNILKAVHTSHLFALCLVVYVFCGCGFSYNGWSHHTVIYEAWYPNLFGNVEQTYLAVFIAQFISQIFVGVQAAISDIFPLCSLTLMNGHLDTLAARIKRIGWDKRFSVDENIEELRNCIIDHKNLLRYFGCIRPIISNILFLQFLVTGLALCLTAIKLTFFSRNFNQKFFTLVFFVILVIQVLPCCWHVNVLMEKSDHLTTAMYSCNWMDQDKHFRKVLIIFMQRSQKTNRILAGNLAPVTLQTFLAIIRFSFSMFAILNQT